MNQAFGGYNWRYSSFFFDFRDRFFCIAFVQEFPTLARASSMYNELKNLLDEKYGPGDSTGDTVMYGTPNGRYALLSIAQGSNGQKWYCTLHYIDEELYQKDTKEAIGEL